MNDPIHPALPRRVPHRRAALVVVALLVIGIAWAVWTSPRRNGDSSAKTSSSSDRRSGRIRRLAVSERAPGGRVCRGRGLRPLPPRDRRVPTARTLWVDRSRRSAAPGKARRPPPLRDSRSSRRGCSTRSSAATGACSTRRRDATRREACSPRSRPRSASLSARARAAPPT